MKKNLGKKIGALYGLYIGCGCLVAIVAGLIFGVLIFKYLSRITTLG